MISMDDKYRSRWKIDGAGHMEITSTIHMVRGFAAHLNVNHSHHFVDSVTGVHTNTIKSQRRLSLLIKQISNNG